MKIAALVLLFLAIAAYGRTADVAQPETPKVVEGNNQLAIDLYAKLHGEKGNLFFSPYSLSTALAMTYGGEARQAYFLARLAARSVQFAITGVLDVLVVWLLQRSGALRAVGLPPVQPKGNDNA